MVPEIASSLITAGGSGVSTAGNIISQLMANHQNDKLALRQNQWNIDQWNRENDYNLPVNQVKRLRDAGLNPDMYYGQNGMMNEAASSPTMERATNYPFSMDLDMGSAVQAYWNSQIAQAQVKNMEADAALKEQQVDESKQGVLESQSRIRKMKQEMAESVDRCKEISAKIKLMSAQEQREIRERIHITFKENMETKKYKLMEHDVWSQIRLRDKQGDLIKAQEVFTYQQFHEAVALLPYKLLDMEETIANKKVERMTNSLLYNIQLEMGSINILKGRKELDMMGLDIESKRLDVNRKGQYYNLDFGSGLGKSLHLFLHATNETMEAVSPFLK